MSYSQRPQSFEQEYPKHEFAPLVDLVLNAASWVARRRAIPKSKCQGVSFRALPMTSRPAATRHRQAKLTTSSFVVMCALAATFSRVYADCPSPSMTDSIAGASAEAARTTDIDQNSEILRQIIKTSKADGLDVYNVDFRPEPKSLLSVVDR